MNWTKTIHHDGSPRYVVPDTHTLRLGDTVTLRLRTGLDTPITSIILRTTPDGETERAPLAAAEKDAACQWWKIKLALSMPLNNYRFYIVTEGAGTWWYNAAGLHRHQPPDAQDFKLLADYTTPTWVQDSVFYQIFPERFADGDPSNNVRNGQYKHYGAQSRAMPWGAPPLPYTQGGGTAFFGGDLQGVTQHLDHLEHLGVNAIYLNPIFTSPSNHKYDTANFLQVDPHFGGDDALVALRQGTEERGMRLMLDVTPNHCGACHSWFTAAQKDRSAPTAEYFTFYNGSYATWLGHASLVKLNYNSTRLREAMYAGPDAILRHWLRPPFRIDAWRLDVANMMARQGATQLNQEIARGIRAAIKAENPEAYILSEHWHDATANLQGDQFDGNMNYSGFTLPLYFWLAGLDTGWIAREPLPGAALVAQWQDFLAGVPWQIALQQFNLLDSHDMPRAKTLLDGDPDKLRAAILALFAFPGVPSIYYGDEIGLAGGKDPENRACMPWDEAAWDHDLLAWHQQLVHLRRTSPALQNGGYQVLYTEDDTVAFLRDAPEEQLVVVLRRDPGSGFDLPVRGGGLPDGARLRDLLNGAEATVAGGYLPVHGASAQLWRIVS